MFVGRFDLTNRRDLDRALRPTDSDRPPSRAALEMRTIVVILHLLIGSQRRLLNCMYRGARGLVPSARVPWF